MDNENEERGLDHLIEQNSTELGFLDIYGKGDEQGDEFDGQVGLLCVSETPALLWQRLQDGHLPEPEDAGEVSQDLDF